MNEFKNMKFKTNSDDESIKLQKYLFGLGYKWQLHGKSLFGIYSRYFHTDNNGFLYRTDKEFFDDKKIPEYTLEEIITYEIKEVEKEFEQFEVFDKLIEINKKNRIENLFISNVQFLKELCTVTFNCGRQKGHTSYIKSRFNPDTDIIITLESWFINYEYKNFKIKKVYNIENNEWMKGYNFGNVKNIWIDNYSLFTSDEINEFYENLAVRLKNNFDKNLTIIGVG